MGLDQIDDDHEAMRAWHTWSCVCCIGVYFLGIANQVGLFQDGMVRYLC